MKEIAEKSLFEIPGSWKILRNIKNKHNFSEAGRWCPVPLPPMAPAARRDGRDYRNHLSVAIAPADGRARC